MNSMLLFFGLVLSFGVVVFGDNEYCDDSWECYDEDLDYENVYCRGYAACYGADILSEEYAVMTGGYTGLYSDITTEYNAYCYGLYACLGTDMVIENDFYNEGFAATAFSTVDMKDDYISRGLYSGYGLTISGGDYSYTYGFFNGAFSTMTDFVRTYNYGLYSLYYADIYSPGNASENVYFLSYGYYSAYGAVFYCQGSDYCLIYCDSTGCDGLTVYVEDTASYYLSCSSDCATCPTVSTYSSLEELQTTDEYIDRESIKQERRESSDDILSLTDGISVLENEKEQVVLSKDTIKSVKNGKADIKIDMNKAMKARRVNFADKVSKYHGHDAHLKENIENQEASLRVFHSGSSSGSSFINDKLSNINWMSFSIGTLSTLLIGVSGIAFKKLNENSQK